MTLTVIASRVGPIIRATDHAVGFHQQSGPPSPDLAPDLSLPSGSIAAPTR